MFRRTFSRPWFFATALFVVLLAANLLVLPSFVSSANIAGTLAVAAPLVLAAMAATPSILSGGGGIDISIGPLIGFVNVFIIGVLVGNGIDSPWLVIPAALAVGLVAGLANGVMVAYIRLQPIVATLGSYLVLLGLALVVMRQPGGSAPEWLLVFGSSIGPLPGALILVALALAGWAVLRRLPYYRSLIGVGSDERAAFTAGVNVARVRLVAYGIGGLVAAFAGIALTALVRSGDPNLGASYTVVAIAAVVLGGTAVTGGVGGMVGSIIAAVDILLIQQLLSATRVPSFWIQVAYGAILLVALAVNAGIRSAGKGLR